VKKYQHILILISILALNACQELVSPDLTQKSYKVKSETKWRININNGQKISKVHYAEYDINGKTTIDEEYNEIGNIYSRSEYLHTSDSSKEKIQIFNNSGVIISQSISIYNYDYFGRVSRKVTYNDNGKIISIANYSYDLNGNVITKIEEDQKIGKFQTNFSYSYNNQGNLIERIIINEGKTQSRDSIVYEPNSKELVIYNFDKNNSITSLEVMKYNNEGLVTEQLIYDKNNILQEKYSIEYTFYTTN